ncbi:RND family efflux transporter, MFP subunit [Dethiosulfatibacter aminovorans DSM 17477]|uniref:RND family efflux transporter, MFP subunit n=1 Tax=Dethiosulfatibacter aminovorans DSM 17477 TaxID=1121476 RepID=A0A1M6CA99_9FIRM|nr:efflux RND transporter periplasmic adaptor subunit [Dethiosulfatibacter aminovorans]SHI57955.1 RND family efflux transporter, MFP subunit [Dethiosulfatibacter aminovorans DSM 17477]
MNKKHVLIVLTLVLALALTGCGGGNEVEEVEESYIAVETEKLDRSQLYIENTFSGKVFADKDVDVNPLVMSEVETVNVKVGDYVEKGQLLFSLDGDSIQNQVDQAYAAYSAALASYEMTKEQIATAKDSFERTKELYEEGVVSKAQYDQAELAASDKPLETAERGLEQARLGYSQALDALDNVEVAAPISGTVTAVNIEAGEMPTGQSPAVTIMDLDSVVIEISVPENIVNKIYEGQKVNLKVESADIDTDTEILSVSDSVNSMTNLYPVKISTENNGSVKAGMFAQVIINTDLREDVLSIPGDALLEKEGNSIVYVESGGFVAAKVVETGLDTGERVEILSGLSEGESIVVKGQNYVSDGTKVKVVRGE